MPNHINTCKASTSRKPNKQIYKCIHIYICTCIHIHKCIHTSMHACIHTCIQGFGLTFSALSGVGFQTVLCQGLLSRTAFSFHLRAGSKPRVHLEIPAATFQNLIRGLLGMTPSLWDTLQNPSFAGAKPTVPLVFRIIRLVQHLLQLHLSGRWPRSLCILKNGAISDFWWFGLGVWDLRVPSARIQV